MTDSLDKAIASLDSAVIKALTREQLLRLKLSQLEEAASIALAWIQSTDHKAECPRIRDDYDCTCGKWEAVEALEDCFR